MKPQLPLISSIWTVRRIKIKTIPTLAFLIGLQVQLKPIKIINRTEIIAVWTPTSSLGPWSIHKVFKASRTWTTCPSNTNRTYITQGRNSNNNNNLQYLLSNPSLHFLNITFLKLRINHLQRKDSIQILRGSEMGFCHSSSMGLMGKVSRMCKIRLIMISRIIITMHRKALNSNTQSMVLNSSQTSLR